MPTACAQFVFRMITFATAVTSLLKLPPSNRLRWRGCLIHFELDPPSELSQAILRPPHTDHSEEGKLSARKRLVDRFGTRLPSRRQLRVIELVAQGLKNKEIAKELRISEHVVRNHLGKIYDKIGVSNRVELALWYWARMQEGEPRRTGN